MVRLGPELGPGSGLGQKFANSACAILKLHGAFCKLCRLTNYTRQYYATPDNNKIFKVYMLLRYISRFDIFYKDDTVLMVAAELDNYASLKVIRIQSDTFCIWLFA